MKINVKHILVTFFSLAYYISFFAQCPKFYNSNGTLSSSPYWVSCNAKDYKLNLKSNVNFGAYTIDWGDGTGLETGSNYLPSSVISHTYTVTVDTFIVLITTGACTVQGVVVMEKPVSAGIKIPPSGDLISCSPKVLQFINASTNVSKTTHFIWKFGDGTSSANLDYLNAGATIDHLYNSQTVNCETAVTLSAYNYCTLGLLTSINYSPIKIYDKDVAVISTSLTSRCWPDNTFDFKNDTKRNCLMLGNVTQRYEKWNFGNYWGYGRDSIIDWKDWPPTTPINISYPTFGTYTVMLMDSSYCGIATQTISVSIINKPTSLITVANNIICQGVPTTFTNSSTPNKSYYWDFGNSLGFESLPYSNPTKTYLTPGNYIVRLVTYLNGYNAYCSDTNKLALTVKPKPISNFSYTPTFGCDNSKVTFTDESTGSINKWDWDFSNTYTSASSSPVAQSFTTTGKYDVSLITSTTNGCKDTIHKLYTVYKSPVANFTANTTCSGYRTPFVNTSTASPTDPIINYKLDFGDGSTPASGLSNFSHIYTSAGKYTVTLQAFTAYCSSTKTISLIVNQTPTANFSADNYTICPNTAVNFTNSSSDASTYYWNLGVSVTSTLVNTSAIYQNSTNAVGSSTVSLLAISDLGCKDSIKKIISVNPKPKTSFATNYLPSCAPVKISYTNTTAPPNNTYLWDFGDGTNSAETQGLHLYNNTTKKPLTHVVNLIATNSYNCKDSATLPILIYPEAIFNFTPTTISGCSPVNAVLSSDSGAVNYIWNFGDGTYAEGSNIQLHDFINSKLKVDTFHIKLISTNSYDCKDTAIGKIIVKPSPTSNFAPNVNSGCANLTVKFINSSVQSIQYDWYFGDGATSTVLIPSHTYTNTNLLAMDMPVSLVVTGANGCKDSTSTNITVYPQANYTFTLTQDTGCSVFNVPFNPTPGATSYFWNFGDGKIQTAFNPVHSYSTDVVTGQTFSMTMTATSPYGCKNTQAATVFAYPKPSASYTVSSVVGCAPLLTRFSNTSKEATSYKWYFGDTATSTEISPQHMYNNLGLLPQDFLVSLVAFNLNGCKDSITSLVNVLPEARYDFVNLPDSGCSDLNVSFFSPFGAKTYVWNFGDSLSALVGNPTHLFVNKTISLVDYTVTLATTNNYGCKDTARRVVRVFPVPQANFFASPISQRYPEATVSFNNVSTAGASYQWNLGDSTLLSAFTIPPHTYSSWGVYSASLTVNNGYCKDSIRQNITILPPFPIANFDGGAKGCSPLTVTFTNTSTYATNYNWNFGDGNTISEMNPTHIYSTPGTYTVTLKSTGPGGNNTLSKQDIVTVYPKPFAYFAATPLLVYIPNEPVFFTNQSQNALSYLWDFGDGNTSTTASPKYKYPLVGEYEVMLIAIGQMGCVDTFKLDSKIRAEAVTGIEVPNAFTPNPNTSNGDGKFDPTALNNDIFHPNLKGVVDYELTIYNKWGELLFKTTNQDYGWNGYYKGKLCIEDVYIYKIHALTQDSKVLQKAGDILLLR